MAKKGKMLTLGRPPVGSIKMHMAIPPDEVAELDRWIADQPIKISRQQALRQLAMTALQTQKKGKKR